MLTPLRRSCLLAALLWALLAVGPATVAPLDAAQPQPINRLATKTTPLTTQEQEDVSAFTEYWINQLATGEPETIRNAIRALNEPLGRMGVTRVFRDEYSRAIIPRLETALSQNTNYEVAVNAMKVGAMLGTERALRFMVDQANPQREQRDAVRLWAAKGFQAIVEADLIDSRPLASMTRDLARAAEREEHWLVLRRQFEALASVPGSLEHQVAVLRAATTRMAESETKPNPKMESIHWALVLMRNQWIGITSSREQQEFGKLAAPAIVDVLEIAEAHWDEAHEDERARVWYRSAVQAGETLLISIDLQVRPTRSAAPDTRLDAAWQRADREGFQTHLRTWQQITTQSSYAQSGGR